MIAALTLLIFQVRRPRAHARIAPPARARREPGRRLSRLPPLRAHWSPASAAWQPCSGGIMTRARESRAAPRESLAVPPPPAPSSLIPLGAARRQCVLLLRGETTWEHLRREQLNHSANLPPQLRPYARRPSSLGASSLLSHPARVFLRTSAGPQNARTERCSVAAEMGE